MRSAGIVSLGFFLCVAALVLVPGSLAQTVICPSCGYENEIKGGKCFHCDLILPIPRIVKQAEPAEAPANHTFREDGRLKYMHPSLVENEIEEGLEHARKNDFDVAYLLLRNASAVEMLTDPTQGKERSARLADLLAEARQRRGSAHKICPKCKGTGHATMKIRTTRGETEERPVPGKRCPACGGGGRVKHSGAIDELVFRWGRAKTRYEALQRARKYMPVGNAWVPLEFEGKLNARQTALLRRTAPSPCARCSGVGRVQCRTCRGRGSLPCSNRKCEDGRAPVTRSSSLTRSKLTHTVKCSTCRGAGKLVCGDCGRIGSLVCPICGGTGERAVCGSCGGQGFSPCTQCGGAGAHRGEPCPRCAGEGQTKCTACKGDGRK